MIETRYKMPSILPNTRARFHQTHQRFRATQSVADQLFLVRWLKDTGVSSCCAQYQENLL